MEVEALLLGPSMQGIRAMDKRAGSWIMVFAVLAATMYEIEQYWLAGFCWAHATIDVGVSLVTLWYEWKTRRAERQLAVLTEEHIRTQALLAYGAPPPGGSGALLPSPVPCPRPKDCGCDGG